MEVDPLFVVPDLVQLYIVMFNLSKLKPSALVCLMTDGASASRSSVIFNVMMQTQTEDAN